MDMKKFKFLLASGLCAFIFGSCTAGGGPGISGPSSGSFVNVQSFSADVRSVSSPGERINFNFRVDYASPSGGYIAELYYNDSNTMPSPRTNFKITELNCGTGSIFPCGTTGRFECTYDGNTSGNPEMTCGGRKANLNFSGKVYFIFRACIYDNNLNLVCDMAWTEVQIP